MRTLDIILYVLACVSFALAVPRYRDPSLLNSVKLNLIALGLLLWVLVPTIALIRAG